MILPARGSAEKRPAETVQAHHSTISFGRNGKAIKLECLRTMLGESDEDGRRRPIALEGSNFMVPVDNVIVATGEALETAFLPDDIEMNGNLIKVNALGKTSIPGIYAGGDASNASWNVAAAIGSGKHAAIGINLFLRSEDEKAIVETLQEDTNATISMVKYLAGVFGI